MIKLNLSDIDTVTLKLNKLSSEIVPYAMNTLINESLIAVQDASGAHFRSVFDRPTPLIQNSVGITLSKVNLLKGKVFITEPRGIIIRPHEKGRTRGRQRLEWFLQSRGFLSEGAYAIPTFNMPRDSYGNPSQNKVTDIINSIGQRGGGSSTRIFAVSMNDSKSRLKPGVYEATDKSLKILYTFVGYVMYRPRTNWEGFATQIVVDGAGERIDDIVNMIESEWGK